MSSVDQHRRLVADEIERTRGAAVIGRHVVVLDSTTSTNDAVRQQATTETEEGLTVFAEQQSAGRGQRGNRWESSAGKSLLFSILLRPRLQPQESFRLTGWAADAVVAAVRSELGVSGAVKQPNDVCVDGRKLAGVLVEMRAQPQAPHLAIAGIGVNVNQSADDFSETIRERAVSLAMLTGQPVDRQQFAIALLDELDRSYRNFRA